MRNYNGRRTNSKDVRNAVKYYILQNNPEYASIKDIKNEFENVMRTERKTQSEQKACENWLMGLGINVDYTIDKVARNLAQWLYDTEERQRDYISARGYGLYYRLLAREILKA